MSLFPLFSPLSSSYPSDTNLLNRVVLGEFVKFLFRECGSFWSRSNTLVLKPLGREAPNQGQKGRFFGRVVSCFSRRWALKGLFFEEVGPFCEGVSFSKNSVSCENLTDWSLMGLFRASLFWVCFVSLFRGYIMWVFCCFLLFVSCVGLF